MLSMLLAIQTLCTPASFISNLPITPCFVDPTWLAFYVKILTNPNNCIYKSPFRSSLRIRLLVSKAIQRDISSRVTKLKLLKLVFRRHSSQVPIICKTKSWSSYLALQEYIFHHPNSHNDTPKLLQVWATFFLLLITAKFWGPVGAQNSVDYEPSPISYLT